MSTLATSTANDLSQSAINLDSYVGVSPVDAWIGSRVRIRRTSRGISEQEFSTSLSIDDLPAFEAGEKRINANLLFRIAELLDVRLDNFFRDYAGYIRRRGTKVNTSVGNTPSRAGYPKLLQAVVASVSHCAHVTTWRNLVGGNY